VYQEGSADPQFWVSPDSSGGRVAAAFRPAALTADRQPHVVVASMLRPTGGTGVQTHIQEFIAYLESHKVPSTLVTPFSWGGPLRAPVFGPRLLMDPLSGAASIRWHRYWHATFLRQALRHILRDVDDVVIYAHCPVSAKAALEARRHRGQRVVMAVHFATSQADEWARAGRIPSGGRTFRAIRELERETLLHLDGIVFVSESGMRNLSWLEGLQRIPSTVVPNFIRATPPKNTSDIFGDLVSIGGLESRKNHTYLLDVLASANRLGRRYTLDLIGEGPDERELRHKIERLHLDGQVRFKGFCANAKSLLPHYRVYVHAAKVEVLPLVVIEAMGAGIPVIAGDVGGISELMDPGIEGRFWPLDDPDEAARILLSVMNDEPKRIAMGSAARKRFESQFSSAVAAPLLLDFLTRVEQSDTNLPPPVQSGGGGSTPTVDADSEPRIPITHDPPATPPKARKLSTRVGLTAIDQGLSSISNFAVGVAVARVAGVTGLGAFSLVYTMWLIAVSSHRALVTDPMAIEGDLRDPNAKGHVRAGLAAEIALGIASLVIFIATGVLLLALGQETFGYDFLAIAPWLPFLIIQDYWRWVGFMASQPGKALANDVVFDLVQFLCFGLLIGFGARSSALAISAWGLGAVAGAIYGLRQFSVAPTLQGGIARLRLRWSVSKWLVGTNAAGWGVSQCYIPLVAVFLGPAGLGGLKAASSLVTGPSLVLIQAGGSVGLPEASRGLKERGWPGLRRVQRSVTGAGVATMGLVLLIIVLFGQKLLEVIYGTQFGQFYTVAIVLALSYCIGTLALGAIISLKTVKHTHSLFRVNILSLPISVIATVILVPLFGILGAAYATLITCSFTAAGQCWEHFRCSRKAAESMMSSPATAGSPISEAEFAEEASPEGPLPDPRLGPVIGAASSQPLPG